MWLSAANVTAAKRWVTTILTTLVILEYRQTILGMLERAGPLLGWFWSTRASGGPTSFMLALLRGLADLGHRASPSSQGVRSANPKCTTWNTTSQSRMIWSSIEFNRIIADSCAVRGWPQCTPPHCDAELGGGDMFKADECKSHRLF